MYEKYVRIRDERGVRDADVARATGIPAPTFSEWKKGRSEPKIQKLAKIAEYFGVSVSYFVE